VQVGTERDLPLVGEQDLAVVVDADGLVLAPHYRAEEDALRLLARVAGTVAGGRGRRCIVQTAMPGHPVLAALRRGTGDEFMAGVLAGRDREGLPPFGDLLVVEVAGGGEERDGELRAAMGEAAVHGPATAGERVRWLVQGPDLRKAKVALRTVVQGWRDAGLRVRVDVDPIDL
jgi:primosomal protein N' (replication factor Y)